MATVTIIQLSVLCCFRDEIKPISYLCIQQKYKNIHMYIIQIQKFTDLDLDLLSLFLLDGDLDFLFSPLGGGREGLDEDDTLLR